MQKSQMRKTKGTILAILQAYRYVSGVVLSYFGDKFSLNFSFIQWKGVLSASLNSMSSFRWSFHRNIMSYLHTFSVLTRMKVKTSVKATWSAWSALLKCSKRHQGSFENPRVYWQPHHLWIMVINVSEVFQSGRSMKSTSQSTGVLKRLSHS